MAQTGIVVIGAGMGGLAASMLLAARGEAVTMLESASAVGGKMRTMTVAGREIDAGPTVLTLRPVFDQLFSDCGQDFAGAVRLVRADVIARHAWSATERLDLYADCQRSADAIGTFAGAAAARGYIEFCAHAKQVYDTMDTLFIRAEKPTPIGMVRAAGLSGLRGLLSSAPFTTLWDSLGTYFSDPRLRQLYGRYATYCGSSPFAAPATLALIAHVEQEGVWLVPGGMCAFASALGRAAEKAGVTIRLNTEVTEVLVERGRANGVQLASGERLFARAVVANCDVGALASGQLGLAAKSAVNGKSTLPRSLSAATWGLVGRVRDFPLAHHSVFFSSSSEREFADLFQRACIPEDPTVYVCAQDRSSNGTTVEDSERLFVIVNAPADAGRSLAGPEELERCRAAMLRTLNRCGLDLTIEAEAHTGPAEFARRFPGTHGAIYGMASHGWTASFRRPGTRSRLPGLYMTGGSVHPGAGLPMAALSGRSAALTALADLASM